MKKNKIMDFFSALGRSLMMPIAALAACGIVLGLTSALMKAQVVAAAPFLGEGLIGFIILVLNKVSGVVFTLLPVLFAISIAMGLAKEEKEVAAFAGFIGYYTFLVASSLVINTGVMDFSVMKISTILGVETLDMGAVAGILIGVVTASLHNKYHKVVFPAAVAFYGGKRFVALIVILASAALGLVSPFIWQPLSTGINGLGSLIHSMGVAGVGLFGLLERALIPTGLHHVLNGLFRTTPLGGAAALAIYQTSPEEKKAKVKALMIAGVAASLVSGITEPLEFSFMFIAPALFGFHAVMGGISFALMAALGVIIGNTGGGLIDFFIWGVFQPGSNWYWVIVVGIVYAFIYYFVFRWYLTKNNISVDVSDDDDETDSSVSVDEKMQKTASVIIEGLGGYDNITAVNNCISRLRVDVKDMNKVSDEMLKKTGSLGIIKPSETHIQVIYGPKVEQVADAVRQVMKMYE